jgi:hypothetical protein
MNDDSFDSIEQQLARLQSPASPPSLRVPVLQAVHRELAAQRWDRRLFHLAAALLLIGIALNWSTGLPTHSTTARHVDIAARTESIVDVALTIAEATDAQTGANFAQHLAALSGFSLSPQESAALRQEIQQRLKGNSSSRRES